jgi:hypothetical protein
MDKKTASERSAQRLVPGLRGGNADDLRLAVPHIEIQMRQKFFLGQGIERIDAEKRHRPGRCNTGPAAYLYTATHPKPVRQSLEKLGAHIEITAVLQFPPAHLTQRRPSYRASSFTGVNVVLAAKIPARAPLRYVLPAPPPRELNP